MNLPPAFDPRIYRSLHVDLAELSDDALYEHYHEHGVSEGRIANELADKNDFARVVPSDVDVLEIGPFVSPILKGPNVYYCDILDENEMKLRAKALGINANSLPRIHYKLGPLMLDGIPRRFSAILSSHCIEHQPDLIGHLKQIERRLEQDGRYFLLIPDRRYCFDRHIASSTIADVIQAHEERRTTHTLKSIVEHRALTVHNNSERHWSDRDYLHSPVSAQRVRDAVEEWRQANGTYIDVHAWYFTPDSFNDLIALLNELGLTSLKVERLYRTRHCTNEFWVVLKLGEVTPHPNDAKMSIRERDRVLIERDSLRFIVNEYSRSMPWKMARLLRRGMSLLARR